MTQLDPHFLRVQGAQIVDGRGQPVYLRGFCIGGWMNMENFIAGYPGHESGARAAVGRVLGEERAYSFFNRFLDAFFTEEDIRFIKSLGCTVARIPLNYRHFEADDRPFEYRMDGFERLDRAIGWARRHQVYIILDLHAVQGWQNRGWHCDNPTREAAFWGQKVFEDRAVALWETLARRYRDEPFIAGYNVMNEPDAAQARWLNHFNRRVTEAIRAIDPDHILFLEGNHYSQDFDELEPPFDANTVYSSHLYLDPGLDFLEYPSVTGGVAYDRAWLEQVYLDRSAYARAHGVPHWMGEFGAIFSVPALEASRLRLLADMLELMHAQGDHWTIWTYKDIGQMGVIYADPKSEWMRRTRPVREAKTALRCDSWIERSPSRIDPLIRQIAGCASEAAPPGSLDPDALGAVLANVVQDLALSQALLPAFGECFRDMAEAEIERMMQSFAFQNCVQRTPYADLICSRLK
jgi:hypothetical protein